MRTIIIGGPMTGKSTLALMLMSPSTPIYCGDPASKAREVYDSVTYLPDGLLFSGDGGAADWIAHNWFPKAGPWVCEGQVMARALRRWLEGGPPSCDRIIVLRHQYPGATPRQQALHKGVLKVWIEIEPRCRHLVKEKADVL